ncbi:hypothetical protein NIES3807_41060 [Microcystis aeruginosa NIES-3807]|uniref:Uma2 family endonuclease n=1 Tax=Microcystis aeruginosa NIES-3807 TaxID=2517785 RepID=A0AAD3B3J5_MICAE|nr:hypothetical protein NIES3807_41060 [Microcystis aeruginosa NIES-3807]
MRGDELEIYSLDGQKFLTSLELSQRLEQERLKAEQASLQLEQASLQLEQERLKAERLAEYIRSLGIDPDTL